MLRSLFRGDPTLQLGFAVRSVPIFRIFRVGIACALFLDIKIQTKCQYVIVNCNIIQYRVFARVLLFFVLCTLNEPEFAEVHNGINNKSTWLKAILAYAKNLG